MSKITNDGLTRSATGCTHLALIWQQLAPKSERVKRINITLSLPRSPVFLWSKRYYPSRYSLKYANRYRQNFYGFYCFSPLMAGQGVLSITPGQATSSTAQWVGQTPGEWHWNHFHPRWSTVVCHKPMSDECCHNHSAECVYHRRPTSLQCNRIRVSIFIAHRPETAPKSIAPPRTCDLFATAGALVKFSLILFG